MASETDLDKRVSESFPRSIRKYYLLAGAAKGVVYLGIGAAVATGYGAYKLIATAVIAVPIAAYFQYVVHYQPDMKKHDELVGMLGDEYESLLIEAIEDIGLWKMALNHWIVLTWEQYSGHSGGSIS
jgi:hypothetical protein